MNSRKRLLLLIVALSALSLACLCLPTSALEFLVTVSPLDAGPISSQEPLQPAAMTCDEKLADLLADGEALDLPSHDLPMEYTLATYAVEDDTITLYEMPPVPDNVEPYQQDTARHRELWDFVTRLVPLDYRRQVVFFVITTDGTYGTLGAVEQTDHPETWSLYLDILDAENFPDLATTLIHEIAHLLTLNTNQVVTDWDVFNDPWNEEVYARGDAACDTYFVAEGCSYPDSYLNRFFERYWQEIYPEWQVINQEEDEQTLENLLYEFYGRYPDQFVSDYAATSPQEDIAESFLYFVLAPAPAGETIAEQKILFFYEFPELTALRDTMRTVLCSSSNP
jgi:hypothetical protein